jgi:hypothetical protein
VRLFSILSGRTLSSKIKHYLGLPPKLTDGIDARQEMGPALFLVIDVKPDGVFLYRYGAKGECVGDTWHMNIDDAKHQAAYEYEGLIQDWQDVPSQVEDVAAFGLGLVR